MNTSVHAMHWLKAAACTAAASGALICTGAHAGNAGPALPEGTARKDLLQHGPKPALQGLCKIDLGVLPIEAQLERRTDRFNGQVKIIATVKNVGLAPYESRAQQQALYLYEDSKLVATREFVNLNAGQTVSVSFVRPWNAAAEFPPTYKAEIGYDPDILLDANPKNDDCNPKNNSTSLSGSAFNKLF